jgi:hypothetical protein
MLVWVWAVQQSRNDLIQLMALPFAVSDVLRCAAFFCFFLLLASQLAACYPSESSQSSSGCHLQGTDDGLADSSAMPENEMSVVTRGATLYGINQEIAVIE